MSRSTDELDRMEPALREFFASVRQAETAPVSTREQVMQRVTATPTTGRSSQPRRTAARWLAGGMVAASLAIGAFVMLAWPGGNGVARAEAILQRAETTAASPLTAGIERLAVEQHGTTYASSGRTAAEYTVRAWYEAPSRQRVESVFVQHLPAGPAHAERLEVWDGSEQWTYDPQEDVASVLRQDPNTDLYEQGVLRGVLPARDTPVFDASCRDAEVVGDDLLLGHRVDIVQLTPSRCGLTLPGSDGQLVLWVERDHGLVLKAEQFRGDGRLSAIREVVALEINGMFDPALLTFSPPPGAEIEDRRDQPLGVGTSVRIEPRQVSLDEARSLATFDVWVPPVLPSAFELESVQLSWMGMEEGDEGPTVHNDWVLMRYADEAGNWLIVTQGFGPVGAGLVSIAPDYIPSGTVTVRGAEGRWVDGSPLAGSLWEAGTMRTLAIDLGRTGGGWSTDAGGSVQIGSPLSVALASNILSVEELVAIAEATE